MESPLKETEIYTAAYSKSKNSNLLGNHA